jgi:hypothetical protein
MLPRLSTAIREYATHCRLWLSDIRRHSAPATGAAALYLGKQTNARDLANSLGVLIAIAALIGQEECG